MSDDAVQDAGVAELLGLRDALASVRAAMLDREADDGLAPEARASVLNMLRAETLRRSLRRDTRPALRALGLTTFDDAGPHALSSVEAVLRRLDEAIGDRLFLPTEGAIGVEGAKRIAHDRADALFGRPSRERATRIMVTLPSHAADDPRLIEDLIERGMDVARINCAHDEAGAWGRMIAAIRAHEERTGRRVKVCMDLAGPKVRTGALPAGERVLKFFPRRDALGRVRRPARVLLSGHRDFESIAAPADVTVPVDGAWALSLEEGDRVRMIDARDKQRTMRVIERTGDGAIVSCDAAAFVTPGVPMDRLDDANAVIASTLVGAIPPVDEFVLLRPGYLLELTPDPAGGEQAVFDGRGVMRQPPRIACTLAEAFDRLEAGHRVLFDDGKVSARVVRTTDDGALLQIETARNNGVKLRADKGINFPDTPIDTPSLTRKDLADLGFAAAHADIVGLSFVRGAEDVHALQRELAERSGGRPGPGVMVKIETARCVERLDEVLAALLRSPSGGVMIARGDLAAEVGWERLASAQRRVLWMAGAAHLPVVWATQVLESLAKKGQPTRAEVTDAAESERAACVMLNKGPFIGRAVGLLSTILERAELEDEASGD